MAPGLLHVTMDPSQSLPEHEFHDWYNNEHGPTRLRLPFFTMGMRYVRHESSISCPSPRWLAVYEVTDMSCLETQEYLHLRSPPVKSQREINVMKQVHVDRRVLDLVDGHPRTDGGNLSSQGLLEVVIKLQGAIDDENIKTEALRIQKGAETVFAWDRVTLYRSQNEIVMLCHLSAALLDSDKVKRASSALLSSINKRCLSGSAKLRLWKPYYKFGPAPRHLSQRGNMWVHHGTRTIPSACSQAGASSVDSYAVLDDGLSLPYRLEGSADPNAPVVCLVNSVLVHWDIWDEFITAFLSDRGNSKYRILRFAPRGRFAPNRFSISPSVTIDLLVEDIVCLLKVLEIPRVECIMGVSLGGATALGAGLKYPEIFKTFLACDTNAAAPPGNASLWADRIAIADKEGAAVISNAGIETIIGKELAGMTVKRWAAPGSFDDPDLRRRLSRVEEGVKANSLEGFKQQVQALYEYDFWDAMKTSSTKGAFLVGGQDGKLPEGMRRMAEAYGSGAALHIVDEAGHLPMVEKPEEVAQILHNFLNS